MTVDYKNDSVLYMLKVYGENPSAHGLWIPDLIVYLQLSIVDGGVKGLKMFYAQLLYE